MASRLKVTSRGPRKGSRRTGAGGHTLWADRRAEAQGQPEGLRQLI